MKHPFFNNRILILYYGLFWLVMGLGNSLLQAFWNNMGMEASLLESVHLFLLYPILGASIWYLIRYNGLNENDWLWNVMFHLVAASILNAIWLYMGFIAVGMVNEIYLDNFYKALPSNILAGYLMYAGYVVFFYALGYYDSLKEKIKREAELKSLVRDAELNALKSQINPHFLFNSLNSISSLTISNPQKAQEMVINLSAFMRYSLQHNRDETVSLLEELENIKLYLGIEKVRFGKKLLPVFEVEEACLQARIPNMILQPLFENAIKYGVYEATSPVSIRVSCRPEQAYFHLTIENDYDPESVKNKGEGIGLRNIRQRLELIYGNPNLIRVTDDRTSYKVELMLPKK
ncbi:sensor histidine kinase [Gaoshiqia sediminis]|uniref:Histidine kinase n=1 Tax=Gaoshiqia sediminis TaxID=2986998 RepID=A0AA41Y391_9BACT|nr:histidine kinase [Gaoshiqia sediminis]MCW0482624.1 histidine kinase [Gaoshiqia sediminis]